MTRVTFAFHSWLSSLMKWIGTVINTSHYWLTPIYWHLNNQFNIANFTFREDFCSLLLYNLEGEKRESSMMYERAVEFFYFISELKWHQMRPNHICVKIWNRKMWIIFRCKMRLLCKKHCPQNRVVLLNYINGEYS